MRNPQIAADEYYTTAGALRQTTALHAHVRPEAIASVSVVKSMTSWKIWWLGPSYAAA